LPGKEEWDKFLGRGGSGGKGIGKGKRREATGAEGGYKILLSCYIARC